MRLEDLVIDLMYEAYAWNRDRTPDITPERWKKILGPEVDLMEAKYQADKAIQKARLA